MIEIRVYLISPWEELENALLQKKLSEVEIFPYLHVKSRHLEFPYESSRAFEGFLHQWCLIQRECPDDIKSPIDIIFFSAHKPTIKGKHGEIDTWEFGLFELPVDPYALYENEDPRETISALSPGSVERTARTASGFNMELYAEFFVRKRTSYFGNFVEFLSYSQIWLDYIEEARQHSCGIIVTQV